MSSGKSEKGSVTMKKNIIKYTALAMTISVVSAAFTSCGKDGDFSSYDPNHYYNTYTEDYSDESFGSYREELNAEEYNRYAESGFKNPDTDPLSTFSVDVDTASYTNARRFIENGQTVPEDAVRVEEFLNYFDYDYEAPRNGDKFSSYVELGDCPWNSKNKLMMIGLQGELMDEDNIPPSNIVFLIDSSGSMASYDKLPLVQSAFSLLTDKLTDQDRISIVTYAGSSRTVIEGADSSDKDEIIDAIYSITAGGGTNGEGGIEAAYKLAEKYFIKGGNNRIIMATDGDLNIGKSSESELTELIRQKRDKGIYFSVLGFGTGNIKDNKMEALADNGDGNYSYIDSVDEARRVLVEEMGGTLFTIAKDVKIQVEFNPSQVKSYRLIGYDNRLMNAEDFYDNSKDAGEVGAGHSVTALYEVELAGSSGGSYNGISLEFASEHTEPLEPVTESGRPEICKLSVAYKDVSDNNRDVYLSQLFGMERYNSVPTDRMKLASAVTEFALVLKDSEFKGESDISHVLETARSLYGTGDKNENFADLVNKAAVIYR